MNKNILNMPSIAYHSSHFGLEIKDIEYGIEDYVLCVSHAWSNGPRKTHRLKIYHDASGAEYFRLNGYKVYLHNCIKM